VAHVAQGIKSLDGTGASGGERLKVAASGQSCGCTYCREPQHAETGRYSIPYSEDESASCAAGRFSRAGFRLAYARMLPTAG
jgi:hypothetical protein